MNCAIETQVKMLLVILLSLSLVCCGGSSEDDEKADDNEDGDEIQQDGDYQTDGDWPEFDAAICTPGRWECRDESSTWRCRDDGMGYESYTYCPEAHRCFEGTCYPLEEDGDVDGDSDSAPDGDLDYEFDTDGLIVDGDETPDGDMVDGDEDLDTIDDDPELSEPEPEPEPEPEQEWDIDSAHPCEGQGGSNLWYCLQNMIDDHDSMGYSDAKEVMFEDIDNVGGRVQCVYTGRWVTTSGVPNNSTMNTEHTWPQSYGADHEPSRSDLNHLFPTISDVNSRRSNHPFGEVDSATWSEGGSQLGDDSYGRTVFEPRDDHKGDVARAVFYFAIRYEGGYSQVPWYREDLLRDWNREDPPSEKERDRNDSIERYQDSRNPFIDRPDFIDAIDSFTRGRRLLNPPPPLPGE